MASAPTHRTLIVANRTAGTPILLQEIERRAALEPTAFVLLVPDVSARKADWTLGTGLKALRQAARGPNGVRVADVEGLVGGADPFASIEQALADGHFDDTVISTLTKRTSEWLKRDLPARVAKLDVPVTVITPPRPERVSFVNSGIWGAPGGG
jgi:hypothetical protein